MSTLVTDQRRVSVGIGQIAVSTDPTEVLVAYGLGSCVGVTFYDPGTRSGGMVHVLLPDSEGRVSDGKEPARYADWGVAALLAVAVRPGTWLLRTDAQGAFVRGASGQPETSGGWPCQRAPAGWTERFGVDVYDGIGSAEMFHVYVTNRPGNVKEGSLGQIVEGYRHRLVDDAGKTIIGQVIVGFGTAMLLNRDIPFKGLITTLLLLPMMLSMAVVGLFWKLLYDPSFGIINYALGLGTFEWLANPNMALYAVALTDIWMWSPFVMLLSLAGLSAVPKHLYEAAAIDRAGPFYTFFRITLPLVAPILMIAIIFRTMEAFKTFDLAYVLTSQPTTEVISIRLYKMAFQEWQTGRSCALAYIVLVMVLAITNIYVKYLNKVKER